MPQTSPRERVNAKIFPFPLDAWYAVAWDHEVSHRSIMARTVAGRPMALYRTESGRPVALADACWHRLAPLSMGKLVGADEIQCPYHGLRYNPAGRCTKLPAQETLNPSASVPSYPIVDRHRYLWVWPGDPSKADPATIPDMHQMADPAWAGDGLTIDAKCNYQLILDNLMDLTHEEFVHGSSLGQDELSASAFSTRLESDQHVSVTRWMIDVEPPAFWAKNIRDRFPDFAGRVDRWQIIHYYAPATICIDVGVAPTGTGAPDGDRSQGVNGYVMNTITPRTERTSHYFWAFMRNYRLDSQQITTELRTGVQGVFHEDEVMLQAQQEAIDANPDYAFYALNIDAGGMWVRRILDRMLAAEGRAPEGDQTGLAVRADVSVLTLAGEPGAR
jgi:phenylpropionate dioxygenase-like ring-hydroxylating dioxygenase large terminal subunit